MDEFTALIRERNKHIKGLMRRERRAVRKGLTLQALQARGDREHLMALNAERRGPSKNPIRKDHDRSMHGAW